MKSRSLLFLPLLLQFFCVFAQGSSYIPFSLKEEDFSPVMAKKKYLPPSHSISISKFLDSAFARHYINGIKLIKNAVVLKLNKEGEIEQVTQSSKTVLNETDSLFIQQLFSSLEQFEPAYLGRNPIESYYKIEFSVLTNKDLLRRYLKKELFNKDFNITDSSVNKLDIPLELRKNDSGVLELLNFNLLEKQLKQTNKSLAEINKLIDDIPTTYYFSMLQNETKAFSFEIFNYNYKTDNLDSALFANQVDRVPSPNSDFNYVHYLQNSFADFRAPKKHGLANKKFILTVMFVVEKNGNISNVTVSKRNTEYFTPAELNKIKNIFSNLPAFNPGIKDGLPVKVRMSQRITLAP